MTRKSPVKPVLSTGRPADVENRAPFADDVHALFVWRVKRLPFLGKAYLPPGTQSLEQLHDSGSIRHHSSPRHHTPHRLNRKAQSPGRTQAVPIAGSTFRPKPRPSINSPLKKYLMQKKCLTRNVDIICLETMK